MTKRKGELPLITELRKAIQESPDSLSELGRLCGIDHSRLSRFVRGDRDLTLTSAAKLCEVLGLHLAQAVPPAGRPIEPIAPESPPPERSPERRKTRRKPMSAPESIPPR